MTPPRLVIYQGIKTPDEDPLAEVRYAGTEWKIRLSTLVREALKGELAPARIEEIARQARTIAEAEGALTTGDIVEVRLQAALGSADPIQLALRILADPSDEILEGQGLWEDAWRFLQRAFGGEPQGTGDALRHAVFRHLILVELQEALGASHVSLGLQSRPADRDQRRRARSLLAQWRQNRDPDRLRAYRDLAVRAEADLGLKEAVAWDEQLAELDTVPVLESLALGRVLQLLEEGQLDDAKRLARARRSQSLWVATSVPEAEQWQPCWQAVEALVHLKSELSSASIPHHVSAGQILQWYVQEGWRVDQAHRKLEAALTELREYGPLDEAIRSARIAYEGWLENLLERFTGAVERDGLGEELPRQSEIYRNHVARGDTVTAYIWVDALRYELAKELADAFRGTHAQVDLTAALATPPTITPVGMASLLPRAEQGVRLALSPAGSVEVVVDGIRVHTVQDRVGLVRAAQGEVAEFSLTELLERGEKDIRDRIGSKRLVVVRSQEIDEAFESDHTAAAWQYVKEIRNLLVRATARLAAAGVERFVIAADHGFLVLSRPLGSERTIESPGGEGELHRRCWVGRGGSVSPSALRLPLADLGVAGDLDLVVPRGLAMFAAAGARRFLHGGLSPQELVVPVVTARAHVAGASGGSKIEVSIAGDRITTGVFSASIRLGADLFTTELRVRISARSGSGEEVARVVAGEGYDEESGLVQLRGGKTRVVTFRVTSPLSKGERVTLHVYDTDTDRLLANSRPAEVVTAVGVE
ncbi:hypothetical protein HRbin30_02923 [bacterium HR30]|nr:hypothetical protein HRbin30_02923 [bacterium HR30]